MDRPPTMTALDPTPLLFGLGWAEATSTFWFVIVFDLPRYTFAFVVVAALEVRGRPSSAAAADSGPLVSVLIPGHDERRSLRRCVTSLRESSYRPLEIVCVDDGSRDGMGRELRRLREQGLVDAAFSTGRRGGKSSAVNLAARRARGEILVFADADATFDRDAIALLVAPFVDPRIGMTTGNIGVRNLDTVLGGVQALDYAFSISLGRRVLDVFDQVDCSSGAFSAVRRRAFLQVGGLDVGPGEDLDLTLRLRKAGWTVRFAERAWCLTDVPTDLAGFVRQRLRWDRDALRLRLRKHRPGTAPSRDLLGRLEFLFTNVGLTLAFPVYVAWLVTTFGAGALSILALVTAMYVLLDGLALVCAAAVTRRSSTLDLWPSLFLFAPFNASIVRAVRLVAYLQEWIFESSRDDDFVPERVRRKASRP